MLTSLSIHSFKHIKTCEYNNSNSRVVKAEKVLIPVHEEVAQTVAEVDVENK